MQSSPEMFPIAEFLKWNREKSLNLNPSFQRGSVWRDPAKSFLIDTILRGMPVPKILFRTKIDRHTQQINRDVVDGQQRLRAIIAFADNRLVLGPRSGELQGKRYQDLDADMQDEFLSYKLSTEQLVNSSDEDILELFMRINSYSVVVNPPELRHAKYDSDFKWSVVSTVKEVPEFWQLGIMSERNRVRMLDASLIAEVYGLMVNGVSDGGGKPRINKLYEQTKTRPSGESLKQIQDSVRSALATVTRLLSGLEGQPIVGPPHVLMLAAAVLHGQSGLPSGAIGGEMPSSNGILEDPEIAVENLLTLNEVLDSEEVGKEWAEFYAASKSSTQRIASRRVRFPVYVAALKPEKF